MAREANISHPVLDTRSWRSGPLGLMDLGVCDDVSRFILGLVTRLEASLLRVLTKGLN